MNLKTGKRYSVVTSFNQQRAELSNFSENGSKQKLIKNKFDVILSDFLYFLTKTMKVMWCDITSVGVIRESLRTNMDINKYALSIYTYVLYCLQL